MLESIQPIADERNISLAQLAINWLIQQPSVTSVLVGARNSAQMLDNIEATSFMLTTEELEIINKTLIKMNLKF